MLRYHWDWPHPLEAGVPQLSSVPPHRNFDEVIACFANIPTDTPLFSKACTPLYSEDDGKVSPMDSVRGEGPTIVPPPCPPAPVFLLQSLREEPIHILNVAIQYADHMEDEALVPVFRAFVQSKVFPLCLWGRRTGCLDLCVAIMKYPRLGIK